MIDNDKLPDYIKGQAPEIAGILKRVGDGNVYHFARQLFKYTVSQILKHNAQGAKRCFLLAEDLYQKGNATVKNAIENVYVYSFSQVIFHDEAKRREVIELVPLTLYHLYKKQVINSHI